MINQPREIHTGVMERRNVALGMTVDGAAVCQHAGSSLIKQAKQCSQLPSYFSLYVQCSPFLRTVATQIKDLFFTSQVW